MIDLTAPTLSTDSNASPNPFFQADCLSLAPFSKEAILQLITLARAIKSGFNPTLRHKKIALLFNQTSTRTRSAFEVASFNLGAMTTYYDMGRSQMGEKESIEDTGAVLSRMYDLLVMRTDDHKMLKELHQGASVPVINAMTDCNHPTQMLADLMTMLEETTTPLESIRLVFTGDASNNIAFSLAGLALKMGFTLYLVSPQHYQMSEARCRVCDELTRALIESGEGHGRVVEVESFSEIPNPDSIDFIYTDVWLSYDYSLENWRPRIEALFPYQVNETVMEHFPKAKLMHCLPAFHDGKTRVASELIEAFPALKEGMEVTDAVFRSDRSIVMNEAENRMHAIEALLYATLFEEAFS